MCQKKMSSFLVLLWLLFLPFGVGGQEFTGKLVYEFQNVSLSREVKEKSDRILGESFWSELNGTLTEVFIKKDNLLTVNRKKDGGIMYQELAEKGKGLVIYAGREGDPQPVTVDPGEKLALVRKGKETRILLGFTCREYEYVFEGNDRISVIAWIADSFPHDRRNQSGVLFDKFFLPHGLAFEKRMVFQHGENIWRLIRIEFQEFSEDTFRLDGLPKD